MWTAFEDAQRILGIPELSVARLVRGRRGADDRWHFFGDRDRRYPIASVTKTFTARAVELAGIDFDSRVRDRLPGFRLHDPRATERMTVRDLLCHRSGLPPHTWAWVFATERRRDWIARRLAHLEHIGPHDNAYRYSNIGYAIAGALLPEDWERFMQSKIIRPLGLDHTSFIGPNWHKGSEVAPPHKAGRGVAPFVAHSAHLISPASELMSTAGDLTRWLDHWRSPAAANTECTTSQIRMGGPDSKRWYALGWRREKDLLWHTGSCTGYSAIIAMRVGGRDAIAILCNQHGVTRALEKLVRGDPVTAADRPRARPARPPAGKGRPATGFTGTWTHPGYGTLVIGSDGSVRFHDTPAGSIIDKTWRLQPYDIDFKLAIHADQLAIPLEPRLPPIKFRKQD